MNLKITPASLHSCMFCKKTKFKKLGRIEKTKMIFGTCRNCKLTQTYIRWSDENFSKYYSSGEYISNLSKTSDPNEWHFDFATRNRKQTILEIKKHITKKDKILEFGCSVGALVNMLQGYNVVGIDIDESAIQYGKNRNINIKKMDIFRTKQKFDIIYSSHVFEHLSNPHKYINQLHNLLNESGKLIIVVPSFLTSTEWGNVPHIIYFQINTLYNFFVNKKWEINSINCFKLPKTKFKLINKILLSSSYSEIIIVINKTDKKNFNTLKVKRYYLPLFKTKIYIFLYKIYAFLFMSNKSKKL